MSAAAKATRLIRRERPADIDLTLYPTEALFRRFRPRESWRVHQRERAAVVAYCLDHGIRVHDQPVSELSPDAAEHRAREAMGIPPHRLGISWGFDHSASRAALQQAMGWALLKIGRGGEE